MTQGVALGAPPRTAARRTFHLSPRSIGFWGFTLALGVFVITPLALLLLNSFRQVAIGDLGFSLTNLTLDNYVKAYTNPRTYTMLLNSFGFAFGSMMIGLVIGTGFAFLAERTDLPFRRVIPAIVLIPLATPGIVDAIAWVFLLSPNTGLINQIWRGLGLGDQLVTAYSVPAMIWVQGVGMITLSYLLAGAILRRMDPVLEEAALGCGASTPRSLLRVTVPLLMPGLAAVALLLFIRGIEAFEVPLLLGFNAGVFVFSTNIYYALRGAFPPDYGLGFAYSIALLVLTVGALLLYQRQLKNSERFTVVVGKNYRPRLIPLGAWKYPALAFMAAYVLVVILLPFFILVWASLLPFYRQPSVEALSRASLENYATVLTDPSFLSVLENTLIVGVVSALSIMFLALISSWFIFRTKIAGRKVLDFVVFLPYAVSGTVVAVAFMILFLSFPNPFYNTIWIIVFAYVVNFLSVGSRFTHAGLVQVHQELEEAARASGAGFWPTLFKVWIPLLTPSLVNGGLFVFILSVKVLSIAAFLQGPNSQVLPVYLWTLFENDPGPAAALSVMFVASIAIVTLISRLAVRGHAAIAEV